MNCNKPADINIIPWIVHLDNFQNILSGSITDASATLPFLLRSAKESSLLLIKYAIPNRKRNPTTIVAIKAKAYNVN